MASQLVLHPTGQLGPYGLTDPTAKHNSNNAATWNWPLEATSTLAYLKAPYRRPTVIEEWAPIEIALFEASIAEYGKDFHQVQKQIGSKTTKQIVDFYYVWKKTAHYKKWKKQYVPPYLDVSSDDENDGK